jgi:hypothetical protein
MNVNKKQPMKVCRLVLILAVMVVMIAMVAPAQAAQNAPGTGSICVLAFQDGNQNQVRDAGEGLLYDVNANLMVNQNLIMANHVTDGKEPFCFPNLPAQQYSVTFSSPFYEPSTLASFTFVLAAGDQITKEFGAVPKVTSGDNTGSSLTIPMTRPVRLGLSAAAALVAMALVAALGLIIFGLFVRRQPK